MIDDIADISALAISGDDEAVANSSPALCTLRSLSTRLLLLRRRLVDHVRRLRIRDGHNCNDDTPTLDAKGRAQYTIQEYLQAEMRATHDYHPRGVGPPKVPSTVLTIMAVRQAATRTHLDGLNRYVRDLTANILLSFNVARGKDQPPVPVSREEVELGLLAVAVFNGRPATTALLN